MDFQVARTAFESTFNPHQHGREGVRITPDVSSNGLHVSVRFQDTDTERGFDVVAEPLPSEHRTAEELGQAMAEVVQRELTYAQLPSRDERGEFRRIVV